MIGADKKLINNEAIIAKIIFDQWLAYNIEHKTIVPKNDNWNPKLFTANGLINKIIKPDNTVFNSGWLLLFVNLKKFKKLATKTRKIAKP